ncbi:ABC transporter permease [Candidatus Bathyarchaeota archaeon]|nr:ABC transporter permease [Candidatus Bathyarchaeota archaeon]
MIPVALGVVILIFSLLQLVPPERRVLLYLSGNPRELNPEIIKAYIHMYGLDQPVWTQFAIWLDQLIHGNLGYSEYFQELVLQGLLKRAPATLEIVLYAAPIIILVGIWAGVNAAVRRDKPFDHASRVLSVLGTSLPSFFFGILLSAIFIATLKWTGPGRLTFRIESEISSLARTGQWYTYTNLMTLDCLLNGRFDFFLDALKHLVLPVTVLVLINTATLVRVARSSMLESLSKTYIIAAKAKGLSQKEVVYKHARRNALIPVVTLAGLIVGGMMTGLVITETVFLFPGLGNWAATAAQHFDIPVVAAYAMFSAIVFVLANLIVDILYAYIDPRIRLG